MCDFGFTGYYTHANSGLDLSATRAYDPNTGRFNQRDPSGEGSGLNLYAYCNGNPVCESDSSGLDPSGSGSSDPYHLAGGSTLDHPTSGGCVDSSPINPQYSQAQLAQLAIANLERHGWSAWAANAYINAGVFAINNESALNTISYILMAVQMLDGAGEVEAAAEDGGLVIGKLPDLGKSTGWREGDNTLNLPPLPPGPGRWEQNAQALQRAINQGKPIRDISPTKGGGFLDRERALLQQNGWKFDPKTSLWSPGK